VTHPTPAQVSDAGSELPDLFDNTVHIVTEIDLALASARAAVVNIAVARMDRSLDGMCRAHAELEKLLGQSTLQSESLGRVLQFHVNRRKAQS
jgi:hypothetical protein